MQIYQTIHSLRATSYGLYEFTPELKAWVREQKVQRGLCQIFLQHTSASLLIQENADPTAREDLEEYFERIVPRGERWYRHTLEGEDDTTSHIKSALTKEELTIPLVDGRLGLGRWQGVYLFEHRDACPQRRMIWTILGD